MIKFNKSFQLKYLTAIIRFFINSIYN